MRKLMGAKGALILTTVLFFCLLAGKARIATGFASGNGDSAAIRQANSSTLQNAPISTTAAQDNKETKHVSLSASAHFEPLLLLLLGSALFSLGTVINLVISRKLKAKFAKARQ
ncbi:MAG TPA: hypothetical protein VNN73_12785 [Blastocatellia bacterium]|nr:hypothetical protein [Blastocatellia bacterium]